MGRGLILTLTMFAAALEPIAAQEPDLFRYAITQGGLLMVVLVLFVYIRALHQQSLAEKDDHLAEKDERLQAMITLAGEVKIALAKSMDATTAQATAAAAQASSLQSMAIALAKVEERKAQR